MPRAKADETLRAITLDTGKRTIDLPVDQHGRLLRFANGDAQTRAAGDGGIEFVGHPAMFGQRTWIGSKRWGFWEQIDAGAFAKTIREKRAENNDIVFNRDHDNRLILARTSNGTLRLSEDDRGLLSEATMGDYTYARDIETALARRDLTGMSFAFDMVTYEWSEADDGEELLTLRELELFDVSVVGMPAYPQTDANLRMDLLAACRSGGLDGVELERLARRLADPDPSTVDALRALAADASPEPGPTTRDTSQPAEATGEPPAGDTTGTDTPSPMALRHLATATSLSRS